MAKEFSTIAGSELDLKVYSGDTSSLSFEFKNDDGTPLNISLNTFRMMIKVKKEDPDASAKITIDMATGFSIGGTSNNILSFNKKIDLKGGVYFYDIQMTESDSTVSSFAFGKYTAVQDVTDNQPEV